MPRDVTLDSNVINHLAKSSGVDDITAMIEERQLRVVVDAIRSLEHEWRRTASSEVVDMLVVKWNDCGGYHVLGRHFSMPADLKKKLRSLSFTGTIDKVVVEIARCTTDRVIVSSDSDFWNPLNKDDVGNRQAPVAKLLREEEAIEVVTLGALLQPKADEKVRRAVKGAPKKANLKKRK